MKILLLGSTGQVGFELHRALAPLGDITAPLRNELDLMDAKAVDLFLWSLRPDLIVNAAAWTAVDKAETLKDEASRLNAGLPAQLATYAAANTIRLIHYSSDYVYAGNGISPWHETSPTGPLSCYGRTKLAGDQAIEASGADFLIFRTSWVYSARGNNFMKTMLRLGAEKTSLNIVSDQIGSPTPARLIAQITTLAVSHSIGTGIYHIAPRGHTSWHGFAEAIFANAKAAGQSLLLHSENIKAISTAEYPTPAMRPLNSRLDLNKLEQSLNIHLPSWESQLELTLTEYLEK